MRRNNWTARAVEAVAMAWFARHRGERQITLQRLARVRAYLYRREARTMPRTLAEHAAAILVDVVEL